LERDFNRCLGSAFEEIAKKKEGLRENGWLVWGLRDFHKL